MNKGGTKMKKLLILLILLFAPALVYAETYFYATKDGKIYFGSGSDLDCFSKMVVGEFKTGDILNSAYGWGDVCVSVYSANGDQLGYVGANNGVLFTTSFPPNSKEFKEVVTEVINTVKKGDTGHIGNVEEIVKEKKLEVELQAEREKLSVKGQKCIFKMSVEKLPLNFVGYGPQEIYNITKSKNSILRKDEFESSENYNKRISNIINSNLLATSRKFKDDELYYDADSEQFVIKIKGYSDAFGILCKSKIAEDLGWERFLNLEIIKSNQVQKGSYLGKNAFGVTTTVHRVEVAEYELSFLLPCDVFKSDNYGFLDEKIVRIEIPPDKARSVKESLRLLFIHKPAFTNYEIHGYSPTIDYPYDKTIHQYKTFAELFELWIYNSRSAEVIRKIRK
jgi:hypothetical protein